MTDLILVEQGLEPSTSSSVIQVKENLNQDFQFFPNCQRCRHGILEVYKNIPFVCAYHPYGLEDCPDFEVEL